MEIDKKQLNIAKNYAKAFYKICITQNCIDKLYQELKDVAETIEKSTDFKTFLENPLISTNDKKEMIYKIFGKDFDLQIINFLNLLTDNKRLSLINTIISEYKELYEENKNIVRVKIISVILPNRESKDKLENILKNKLNKEIIFEYETDRNIIGGLIIKIGNSIIDLSLHKKIENMEKKVV